MHALEPMSGVAARFGRTPKPMPLSSAKIGAGAPKEEVKNRD